MYRGQIIRRRTRCGKTPIGPYLKIVDFMPPFVKATTGCRKTLILRENVYEAKLIRFVLSDVIVDRLKDGRQSAVIHDITPKWRLLYEKQPELVQFRSEKYPNKVLLFKVDSIEKVYCGHSSQIRIQLSEELKL